VVRVIDLLRPRWKGTVAALALILLWTGTLVAGPALVAYAIDEGIRRHRSGPLDAAVLGYLAAAVSGAVFSYLLTRLVVRLGEDSLRDLRRRVFDHIQAMPMAFFDSERTGRLVSRMTTDMDALENLVQQGLVQLVSNAFLIVVTLAVLLVMSPELFGLTLLAAPVLVAASRWFRRSSSVAYLSVRDSISRTLTTLQEGLAGIRVVQAFAGEEEVMRRFRAHNSDQLRTYMRAVSVSARYFPVIEASSVATTAGVVGVGGLMAHAHLASVGTVVAFVLYMGNLFAPIQQTSQQFDLLQSAGAAMRKLSDLLATDPPLTESPGAVELPESGELRLEDVSFSYSAGAPPALTGVSLSVPQGERVALVGPTGAGKTTLAKVMARLYDPTEGTVSFGGVDLVEASFDSLRRRIVVVPQEGFLFSGTIADNVRMGRLDATDSEVEKALASIGALERFAILPDGLGTVVTGGGTTLSAGERQLVSLARVALVEPAVLILDEATSSLDPATEEVVEEAIDALCAGRTVIVIAHRLSTAQRADRVVVVSGARVVESGTHAELVEAGGTYAAMYEAWLGGDPVAQ
jgi:ATP-binding cassette subfamily B protein